jgi:endonuclease-3
MAAPSRTAQYNDLEKVLRKYYQPVPLPPDRPVLETLLFGCCLENARYEAAEEAFAALVHNFFDFNEVRVSSVRELSEVMSRLPDPAATAVRVKRILQDVFEATYSFELEELRKQNLGPAVARLEKIGGTTKFSVAYVVQATLGGHAIPVDSGTLQALYVVDLVREEDVQAGVVPGLERAIPKNKGVEFASLLHQLGADFAANPYASALHQILLSINPEARSRLPKRRAAKAAKPVESAAAASSGNSAEPCPTAETSSGTSAEAGKTRRKRKPAGEKPGKAGPDQTPSEAADTGAEISAPAAGKKRRGPSVKKSAEAKSAADANPAGQEPAASGLSKRKPR